MKHETLKDLTVNLLNKEDLFEAELILKTDQIYRQSVAFLRQILNYSYSAVIVKHSRRGKMLFLAQKTICTKCTTIESPEETIFPHSISLTLLKITF